MIKREIIENGLVADLFYEEQGKGLPFLAYSTPISKMILQTLQLRKIHEDALRDEKQVEEASIPVENIKGSVLLISGTRDSFWPTTYMSDLIEKRLTTKGFEPHCEHMAVDTNHFGLIINKACWQKVFEFIQENYT